MSNDSQPVQLRLGFGQPTRPLTMHLMLSGVHVLVETDGSLENEAWSYLSEAGAEPVIEAGRGLSFPAARLTALSALPSQVHITPSPELATLVHLVENPSADEKPAELSVGTDGALWLSWWDGASTWTEALHHSATAALMTAELPFVASHDAFETLRRTCQLPLLAGRAKVNLDGFVEITTSRPQLVESAPLPGLFRVDDTHYGLALPHAHAVDSATGFIWEGSKPLLERGPGDLPALPMPLSSHAAADLRDLVDHLAAYRAQAVVWDSGLGRRVFALAAVEALDAWPLLIVCTPAATWAWQRHLEMFGRSASLSHFDADAHIVTYRDLVARKDLGGPQAVIFDDLASPQAVSPQERAALRRLDGLVDAYRIGLSSAWPHEPVDVLSTMAVLRPGEFNPHSPVPERYPPNAADRFAEHVAAYTSRRSANDPGRDDTLFRRSSVRVLQPTEVQRNALRDAATRHAGGSQHALLADSLEILSAGPQLALSPKIPAAVAAAAKALDAGRRVAILTRHRRTATLVRATLRATDAVVLEASAAIESGVPQTRLAIIRYDRELPDVRWFDEVIVIDYPWSTALLEAAVGPASDESGPLKVSFVHLAGTLDDRLAMLAARRRELGSVIDQSAVPSDAEITYLFEPR